MSKKLTTVTGLSAESALARTLLTWTPLGWEPLIDHYRVYGVPGQRPGWQPSEEDLIAKTVYPRWTHHGLEPAGEEWTYAVAAVSDAGSRSAPSGPLVASSAASVTATGIPLATLGQFDGKGLEFRFSPGGYAKIPTTYPLAVFDYNQGEGTPGAGWPYLLPGPGDGWAGYKAYTARWHITLAGVPGGEHDLALWLIDTTRLGGRVEVEVNGSRVQDIVLVPGATRGSREADATVPGTSLVRSYYEFAVPAGLLRTGENLVQFRLAEGGWVAWDAIGLYARA